METNRPVPDNDQQKKSAIGPNMRDKKVTDTPRLTTLADLHDHSAKPRQSIPPVLAEIESTQKQIEAIEQKVAAAESALTAAEHQTPKLESAAHKADAKHTVVAAAEYGAHIIKLSKLRISTAEIKADADAVLPDLREQVASLEREVVELKQRVKWGKVENAIALYGARLGDANLAGVIDHIKKAYWDAGIHLHNTRQHPIMLDLDGDKSIGRYEVRPKKTVDEDFYQFYRDTETRERQEAEKPADETAFNTIWQEVKAS